MSSARPHPLAVLASLRLTVVLLVMSIILVFAATLDQVHLGVWGVQEKYFRSFFVFSQIGGTGFLFPVFPGGTLLGAVLIVNLVTAHLYRFKWSWKKSGIWLTHIGLILLLAGEGLSGMLQKDNQMRIDVGQTRRYSESFRETELAVIETTHPDYDQVVAIPAALLTEGGSIQHPLLPFVVKPVAYFANADAADALPGDQPAAEPGDRGRGRGHGGDARCRSRPSRTKRTGPPATWSWSGRTDRSAPFSFPPCCSPPSRSPTRGGPSAWPCARSATTCRSRSPWRSSPTRSIRAPTFRGISRARSACAATTAGTIAQVRIFMNNPLRFGGRAFYQAGYANNDRTTVLQVVRNPSWQIPYLSCALIVLGPARAVWHPSVRLFPPAPAPASAGTGTQAVARGRRPGARRLPARRHEKTLCPGSALLALVWVGSTLIPRGNSGAFDLAGFGRLPVLADGRIKPLDTIARTGLLMLQGRQRLVDRRRPDGRPRRNGSSTCSSGPRWRTATRSSGSTIPTCFRFSAWARATAPARCGSPLRNFSPGLAELDRQAQLAEPVDASARTAFQRAVVELREHLEYYSRLKYSLQTPDGWTCWRTWPTPPGWPPTARASRRWRPSARCGPIPPAAPRPAWTTGGASGSALLAALAGGAVEPAACASTPRSGRRGAPRSRRPSIRLVQAYQGALAARFPAAVRRCACRGLLQPGRAVLHEPGPLRGRVSAGGRSPG